MFCERPRPWGLSVSVMEIFIAPAPGVMAGADQDIIISRLLSSENMQIVWNMQMFYLKLWYEFNANEFLNCPHFHVHLMQL